MGQVKGIWWDAHARCRVPVQLFSSGAMRHIYGKGSSAQWSEHELHPLRDPASVFQHVGLALPFQLGRSLLTQPCVIPFDQTGSPWRFLSSNLQERCLDNAAASKILQTILNDSPLRRAEHVKERSNIAFSNTQLHELSHC